MSFHAVSHTEVFNEAMRVAQERVLCTLSPHHFSHWVFGRSFDEAYVNVVYRPRGSVEKRTYARTWGEESLLPPIPSLSLSLIWTLNRIKLEGQAGPQGSINRVERRAILYV